MSQAPARQRDHTDHQAGTPHRGWLLRRPTFGGLAVALVFWWFSLQPSMLPRTPSAQGAVSGLSAAVGYLLGTLAGYGTAALLRRLGREPTRRAGRLAWLALGVVTAVVVAAGLGQWTGWQNQQRDLVDMEHLSPSVLAPLVGVALAVFVVLFLLGRLVGHGIVAFDRLLSRRLPRLVAHAVTAAVFVAAGVFVTRDVVVDGFLDWANRRFAAFDTTTAAGVVAPTTPAASGSPASLVPWATLGEYGRSFVAGGTTLAELRAFHGPEAGVREPVRVYAGLRSAGSADERAALAVRELERTGAFEREVLVVVTTTGTGWIDPDAADAIEYLHGGDTAMAGLQYSYLPSWISFLVDRDEAAEAGTALYRQVHRRWSKLPADSRPRLIVFGEGLGSFGAEAAFRGGDAAASLGKLVAGSDGALFTGPTATNHIWDQLTDAREPGSPVWKPAFGNGTAVRFANQPTDLERPDPAWRQPRVLYVHHPSDPVGNATLEALWRRPEWTERPKGYDVPARGRLVPDRHRPPAGGRPDRRLQRPLRLRPQLRASTSPPAGPPSHPPTDGPRLTPSASSTTSRTSRPGERALSWSWPTAPGRAAGRGGRPSGRCC